MNTFDASNAVAITSSEQLTAPAEPATPTRSRSSLKQQAALGSLWTVGGHGISQVLRFVANLFLARILFPEAFGLMSLVNALLVGLTMFSDLGIAPAIIKHANRDDRDFYDTAWTVQIIRGLVLTLLGCALAFPMAIFFREPQLALLIPAAAFTALIAGFNSIKLFTANRDMRFGGLIGIEIGSQVLTVVIMIAIAWWWESVWALVIGGLVGASAKAIFSHLCLAGPRDKLCWHSESANNLFRFGRWIFLSTIFTFLAIQSDRLMLGRLVSLEVLGVYSLAMAMAMAVFGVFGQLTGRVLMPVITHAHNSVHHDLADTLLRFRRLILSAAAIFCAALVLTAPGIVHLLYDSRYSDAGWMTQLLGVGLWFTMLQQTSQAGILATDRSRALATSNAANFVVTLFAAPMGFWLYGIAGFIAGWTLGNIVSAIILDIELERHGVHVTRQSAITTAQFVVLCVVGYYSQHVVRAAVGPTYPEWLVDGVVAFCLLATAAYFYLRNTELYSRVVARK